MSRWLKYIFFLAWIAYLFACGVLIFARGFLLSRQTLPYYSSCLANEESLNLTALEKLEREQLKLHSKPLYRCQKANFRIVLLVIDALKYEFTEYNETSDALELPAYKNKMPIFKELLASLPNNTRLMRFLANPPTTTLQRLKGLTTGSLPTFVDAGFNFGAPEISEDNILYQIKENDGKIVVMGDDVWVNLFPGMSIREYPYPSFDMFDLDTVDSAVEQHLKDELQMKDWNLLVAHMLGVDHCGHAYGPNHPEMSRKLRQMNDVVRSVIDTMDEDTLLLVIGDHGMTTAGDHGGESEEEITSALFLYSPLPLLPSSLTANHNMMYQVDLVPTLSYILGVPIPFSNLGKVVLDLLPQPYVSKTSESHIGFATEALVANVEQIMVYIHAYSRYTTLFSKDKLTVLSRKFHDLRDLFDTVSDVHSYNAFRSRCVLFLNFVRESFEEVWVQFDSFLMSRGLVLTFLLLSFAFIVLESISGDELIRLLSSGYLLAAYIIVILCCSISITLRHLEKIDDAFLFHCVSSLSLSIFLLAIIVVKSWKRVGAAIFSVFRQRSWSDICARVVHLLSLLLYFSNSYVVYEGQVLVFLVLTLSWVIAISSRSSQELFFSQKRVSEKIPILSRIFGFSRSRSIVLMLFCTFLLRLTYNFWSCREEQKGCEGFNLKTNHSSFTTLVLLALVALWTTAIRMWLRACGNLVGFSLPVTVARYVPTTIVVFLGGMWVLRAAPKESRLIRKNLPWPQQHLPKIVYGLIGIGISAIVYNPLCVYLADKTTDILQVYGHDNVVPQIFNQMKNVIAANRHRPKEQEKMPVVYGIATAYSSAMLVIVQFLCFLFIILLADFLASSIIFMFLVIVAMIIFLAYIRLESLHVPAQLYYVPWSTVVLWGLLSSYFFYATGHQPAIANIHWYAAFVGLTGQFQTYIVPAFLIAMNTFCSQALFSFCVPFLVVAPFTMFLNFPRCIFPQGEKYKTLNGELHQGEIVLVEKEGLTQYAIFKTTAKYLLFHATRVFSCMLAASLHCRHLMVWKIFAPRFIFEGLGFFVTIAFTFLGFLFFIRVSKKIERLINSLINS